jgi:plastocyanin
VVAAAPTALSVGQNVSVTEFSFSPSASRVSQGASVTWSFDGTRDHTSTSDQGFWDSGTHADGTFSEMMPSAGKFTYHCNIHAQMQGSVVVPLKVVSGSAGAGWRLRWSAATAGAERAFDVQSRRRGTTSWGAFKTNTTTASALFNPARAGTYQLRARTSNTAAGQESGWSPVISRRIS